MEYGETPPCSGSNTPDTAISKSGGTAFGITTPISITSTSLDCAPEPPTYLIPKHLTQATVDADPQLKRFQQDLLILTSINDNETLHWRPSWFKQEPHSKKYWTLHNPPNVVTERIPHIIQGRQYFTRRMRRADDPPPYFIKSWNHWRWYCELYGIPEDFLCEEHVELMRLGLPRDGKGMACAPPTFPLYPEPQPPGHGRYILDPSTYATHLPSKFRCVDHAAENTDLIEVVVVHSNGALTVEHREIFFMHPSQWTHFDGYGGYRLDDQQILDDMAPKEQGRGRRWSYLPWTTEQEESCRPFKLKLRIKGGGGGAEKKKNDKLLKELE